MRSENENNYKRAVTLFKKENFEQAAPLFRELSVFKDSDEYLQICENEIKYSKAYALMQQELYEQAGEIFKELEDFRILDVGKQIGICKRGAMFFDAERAFELENYSLALKLYKNSGSFRNGREIAEYYSGLEDLHYNGSNITNTSRYMQGNLHLLDHFMTFEQIRPLISDMHLQAMYKNAFNLIQFQENYDLESALGYLKTLSGRYRQATELYDIYKSFSDKDYEKFVSLVKSYAGLEYMDLSIDALRETLINDMKTDDEVSLDNLMEAYYASRQLIGLTGNSLSNGPDPGSKYYGNIFESDRDSHAEMFGENADGKVLIIYSHWGRVGRAWSIKTSYMDWLPKELIPKSADEVEYLLTVEYSRKRVEKYDSGTIAIQIIAEIKLIECPSGRTIKTFGTVKGSYPPIVFQFTGDPPDEKSGGGPDSIKVLEKYAIAIESYVKIKTFEDFEYSEHENGIIVHKYTGSSKTPAVPDSINGMPVTIIRSGAFEGHEGITQITLSKNLQSIASGLFKDFDKLEAIILPDKVISIGSEAFSGCKSLETVILNDGLRNIGSGAFSECSRLEEIIIPYSTYNIEENAFTNCSSLKNISLPASIRTINSFCFSGCKNLKQLDIPSSVEIIKEGAFSHSGITSVTLPEKLVYIGETAFEETSISEIEFPASLKYIAELAFKNCLNLKEIHIPETVTWIHHENFLDGWLTVYVKEFSCAYSVLYDSYKSEAKIVVVKDDGI